MVLATFSYVSRLLVDLSDDALAHIRQASGAYNRAHDVTGLLLFDGHHFAQVIEGPQAGIARVRARIMHDPRHELIHVGPELATAGRQFRDWAMRVVDTRPDRVAAGVERELDAAGHPVHPELLAFFRRAAATP